MPDFVYRVVDAGDAGDHGPAMLLCGPADPTLEALCVRFISVMGVKELAEGDVFLWDPDFVCASLEARALGYVGRSSLDVFADWLSKEHGWKIVPNWSEFWVSESNRSLGTFGSASEYLRIVKGRNNA